MPQAKPDLYALPPEAVREPPATLGQALRKIGPGLILAGSVVGTGELIATTQAGAQAGFALLWFVIFCCFIKVFVQIELGRYAISSGDTTMTGICRMPGGRLLTWWWLVMLAATVVQLGAMVGGVGQSFHMIFSTVGPSLNAQISARYPELESYVKERPELIWSILTAVVTAVVIAAGSYRIIERVCTTLVLLFTLMTIVCLCLLPWTGHSFGWNEIADGFTFQVPAAAVITAFALIGLTGVGANELIAYPYWCIEKGYARNVGANQPSPEWLQRARGWLKVMQLDAWASLVVYTVATLAFFLLGAAVLHETTKGEGLPDSPGGMMSVLADMYAPVLGNKAAVTFIALGGFSVLYSTLVAASGGNARMLTDMLRVNRVLRIENHRQRTFWVRLLSFLFPLVGLGLFMWIGKPVLMVVIGGVFQSVTLPLIAVVAIYLRYRHTDRRLTPGRAWDFLLWLSMLALGVAAGWGLWQQKWGELFDTVSGMAG